MPKFNKIKDRRTEFLEVLTKRDMDGFVDSINEGFDKYSDYILLKREIEGLRGEQKALTTSNIDERSILKELKLKIQNKKKELDLLEISVREIEKILPNWLDPIVPLGIDETFEKAYKYSGKPKILKSNITKFKKDYGEQDFEIVENVCHHTILTDEYVDEIKGVEIAGSRFYFEKNEIAFLDLALSMYAFHFFNNNGYGDEALIPPYFINRETESQITHLETFEDSIFELAKGKSLLIPSSEHSIAAKFKGYKFQENELPFNVVAWSPCFRREAGSQGKDTRGLFRVKQFHKVELHTFCNERESREELKKMCSTIESFMDSLNLPYRNVYVPSGDMDKRAKLQIDIQTWFPGQCKYRETHSIAELEYWISEKLHIKNDNKELINNIYGTGVAVQRLICAIVENNFDYEKSGFRIPKVLIPFMNNIDFVKLRLPK